MDSKDDVKRSLREAFASVACPYQNDNFTAQYWIDMREHINNLEQDELQWELPRILEALVDDPGRKNLDLVLMELDVQGDMGMDYSDILERDYGKDAADQLRRESQRWKAEAVVLYSIFTRDQACAIARWLEMVRSWQEYLFFEEMVDSAIRYWKGRCY